MSGNSRPQRRITRGDLMAMADYAKVRKERRQAISARKADRRLEVGPHATFYFENFDTMWMQIHEMLFIERGGDVRRCRAYRRHDRRAVLQPPALAAQFLAPA